MQLEVSALTLNHFPFIGIERDQNGTERNPSFETRARNNRSLGYDQTMFRQFPVFTVLSNLRKQISLICLLSVLKISQPKHGFHRLGDQRIGLELSAWRSHFV
jgi:hypothetical protein